MAASPLAVFTQQKVKTPPPAPTPPPTPISEGTPVDPPAPTPVSPTRPKHPPPPPPVKQKPQVPRKPQMKRVSFTQEPQDEFDRYPLSNDTKLNEQPVTHEVHEEVKGRIDTNDACAGLSSSLLINRPKTELEVSRPVPKASPILADDVIIPPPPLFDTNVSDSPFVSVDKISVPPITIIPKRIVLPQSDVAETTMQSSNSTNSPETDVPPPVNYNAYPTTVSYPIDIPSRLVKSEVPSYQLFRTSEPPSLESEEYYNELSVSPGGDLDPPELLHAHYATLPTVSHLPNSPCNLHPDQTFSKDTSSNIPTHYSLRDMRIKSISPSMVHSSTYPPINPYPSLTTVAGTFNPYTCTLPVCVSQTSYSTHKPQVSPSLASPLVQDINANVTRTVQTNISVAPKSVQSERRVRFGEVRTVPESDTLSISSERAREASSSPTPDPIPAWSSKIKAFAIGEVIINVRHLPSQTHYTQLL